EEEQVVEKENKPRRRVRSPSLRNTDRRLSRMWRLSTGKYVEEELFKLGKSLNFEQLMFIYVAELNEIDCVPGPHVPELSDDGINFLSKFLDKLKRNSREHKKFDVREIQSGSLKDENLETWFNCHVWNVIFDQAFGDLNAISVVRGESRSLASASRKNAKRLSGERQKMGRRVDWVLRSVINGDKDEFGAGKAGKSWTDESGMKFLKKAGLKLPKTLKDMLIKLMAKVKWDEEICAKIQTVGIIRDGLMIMTVYLDNPKSYICRIRRELMEVPDNAEDFPSILTIFASVLIIKAVVRETIKTVQAKKQTVESFKRAGCRKRPLDKNEHRIFSCLSTPKKAKVCAEAYAEKSYPSPPCPGSPQESDLFSYLE
ncbi:5760_t:CDS:2, partial [Ambispora leptoticha]